MGFGACTIVPEPQPEAPVTSSPPRARRSSKRRVHCDSFYWDLSSVVAKTACLAVFFVLESPRRVLAFTARKPEPAPFFTCAKWGYRKCACGHHYYAHGDVPSSGFFAPSSSSLDPIPPTSPKPPETQQTLDTKQQDAEASTTPKKKRRRRWFIFF